MNNEPEVQQPVEHGQLPTDVRRFREFLTEYGHPLAIGLGIAAIAILGLSWYRNHQHTADQAAAEMLSVATSGRQLEEIRTQYPSTVAAQIATLALAKNNYDSANYNQATTLYSEFEKQFPKSPMVEAAALGKIHCMEASGRTEEALAAFAKFASDHPDSYLTPTTIFGQARILDQLGRLTEARILYENFIAAHPGSARAAEAKNALASLQQKLAAATH